MTSRTRTTTAQAKKTSPRKTTAKKAAARPARKTPAKKTTTPRLSLVKATPPSTEDKSRLRDFVTDAQIYATHAARLAGLPIHRIRDWRDHRNGTATRPLRDGSHLHYTQATRTLRWQALCPMGAIHEYVLNSPSTAAAARVHVNRCQTPHADLTHIPALTADELAALGILHTPTWARPDLLGDPITETIPVPFPLPEARPRALADQLTHSTTGTTDTQPLPLDGIAAGLTTRADNDSPKEHPQP